jgi:hypothetical protein
MDSTLHSRLDIAHSQGRFPRRRQGRASPALILGLGAAAGFGLSGAAIAATGVNQAFQPPKPTAPAWAKDLIVYEIAPKGFTSPNGPESGTFNSLKEKLPYLHRLGINGIWLTGHSEAPPHLFYNVWSQYGNVEPDKIEPTLGTPAEFKSLIQAAHRNGIRVFLDVHDHGLHPCSPIVAKHPEWFKGDAGGMMDFDWYGDHKDQNDWWVGIWTDCVKRYGVDGFRIDCSIARPDVWARIRKECTAAGHEIAVFEEGQFPIHGASDFAQGTDHLWDFTDDVGGFFARKFGEEGKYHVEIHYADGSVDKGDTDGNGPLTVHLDGLGADKVGRRSDQPGPDGIPDIRLTVGNVARKPLGEIVVNDQWRNTWGRKLALEGEPPTLHVYVATLCDGLPSEQISCHDQGWEGTPADETPYRIQGSRASFGYGGLFTPNIPIFFAGEEFDATFRPIPWLAPHYLEGYSGDDRQGRLREMYAAGSPDYLPMDQRGKGKWLYGCMLDWTEPAKPVHREMLEDVTRMIAIRKSESAILSVGPDSERPRLKAVPCKSDIPVPVPYIRWNGSAAILIAANRVATLDAHVKLAVPLKEIGLGGHERYKVTDLWLGGPAKTYTAEQLAQFEFDIQRDKTPRGGLRLFKIMPMP